MKILAVDYGDSRTGFALCDSMEIIASPLEQLHERNFGRILQKTLDIAQSNQAELIVVGNPINMNGTEGERSKKSRLFAEKLHELGSIPVEMWDERNTTISAARILNETNTRGKKRKSVIDSVAAMIILESYMAYRKCRKD